MSKQRSANRPKRPPVRSGAEPYLVAELVGFLAALAIAGINLLPKPEFIVVWPDPVPLLLMILFGGTVILAPPLAFLTLLVSDPLPADMARSLGSRLGFRSAVAYLLAAFGLISLEQLLHAADLFPSLLGAIPSARILTVFVMVAMPVVALGSFSTSVWMWGIFNLRANESLGALAPQLPNKPQVSSFPLIAVIALLGLAASALDPDLLRQDRPAPDQAKIEPSDSNSAPTSTIEPTPQLFSYERPIGLDFATPAEWKITTTKTLASNFSRPFMVASPDDKLLAVAHLDRGSEIEIFDLTTATISTTFAAPTNSIKTLTWSPDSQRIFTVDSENQIAVLDLDPHNIIPLPLPESEHLPNSDALWWQEREIVFFDSSNRLLSWLDLDSLALDDIVSSPFWRNHLKQAGIAAKDAPPALPEKFIADPTHRETSRCRLSIAPVFTAYRSPSISTSEWKLDWKPSLVIEDRLQPRSLAIAGMAALDGDLYHIADDCTKLVRVRNSTAEIFYFGIEDRAAPVTFDIPLLESFPDPSLYPELTEAVKTHSLCVWICPHVINPLNDRTVGPDRNHPKAIARLVAWKDKTATFTLAHSCEPLASTDVLCDPHIWRNSEPVSIKSPFPSNWWRQFPFRPQTFPATSPIDAPKTDDEEISDVPDNLPELEIWHRPDLAPTGDAFVFRAVRFPDNRSRPAAEPEPEKIPSSAPVTQSPEPSPAPAAAPKPPLSVPQEPPPAPDPVRVIEVFLRQHHRDLCGRSIPNLVENYSAQIIDASMPHAVHREMMRRNFSTPEMGWPESIELVTPMTIGRLRDSADRYKAQYTMRLIDEGKAYRFFVQIFLILTSEGPKIYSEQNTYVPPDRR